MADLQPDRGLFLSALDAIDRPGQAVKNVLRGNLGAAGRQLGQLGVDLVDALLPGDWLPNDIAKPEDYVSGRELIGGGDDWGSKALGFGVDILTDPLTYIPGAVFAKAGKIGGVAAGRAVKAADALLPGTAEKVAEAGRGVRSVFGAQRVQPELGAVIRKARDTGTLASAAGLGAAKKALTGFDERKLNIIGDALDNFRWENGKLTGELVPSSADLVRGVQGGTLAERIAAYPEVKPEEIADLSRAAEEVAGIGRTMRDRPGIFGSLGETAPDVLTGKRSAVLETPGALSDEYLMRSYEGLPPKDPLEQMLSGGTPNPAKGRKLEGFREVADFLGKPENAKVVYERNVLKRLAKRSESQGTLATRADIGQGVVDLLREGKLPLPATLTEESAIGDIAHPMAADMTLSRPNTAEDAVKTVLGKDFVYTDKDSRSLVEAAIGELAKADPESAKVAIDAFSGMAPRGAVTSFLAKANAPFKKAAVYGFAIPKMGSIIRNRISGAWQALSNPEARTSVLGLANPLRISTDMGGAIADSLGLSIGKDRFSRILGDWEKALAASGGSEQAAIANLATKHKDAAELIANGGLDGFVRAEDLVKEMQRTPWQKKFANIADWPGRMFRGVEDRMRLGLGLDLMAKGHSAADAAKITGDTLYRYASTSVGNRTARDIIPFFQFSAKAIPQQAKFLAEKPAVAVGLAEAFHQDQQDPIYPYLEGRANIPIGKDEQANQQIVSGFGLPFEALTSIPNPSSDLQQFGRQIEQSVVGQSQPLLKTLYSAISGRDPYFGSGAGSYDKLPIVGSAGAVGRAYNQAAATGLIQPVDSVLRSIDKVTDSRRSIPVKLLDTLTGANVVNVDPDLALQQQLTRALERNPNVAQSRTPINLKHDPEVQQLLDELRGAKKRIHDKRAAKP